MKHENVDISTLESLNLKTPKGYREFIRRVIKYADYFCLTYEGFDYVTIEYLKSKKSIFDFGDIEEAEGGREFLWDLGFVKEGKQFFKTITHEEDYWFM